MVSFLAKVKIFDFWPKTMVHGLIFGSPKKVRRKVCHPKENTKRNLMVLVSIAEHLQVVSYKRLKFRYPYIIGERSELSSVADRDFVYFYICMSVRSLLTHVYG